MRKGFDMLKLKLRGVAWNVPEFQWPCPALIWVTLNIERGKISLGFMRYLIASNRIWLRLALRP